MYTPTRSITSIEGVKRKHRRREKEEATAKRVRDKKGAINVSPLKRT
jgi:hypothetical protein